MKIAAIILFVLQLLSVFGGIANGSLFDVIAGGFVGGVPGFSRMLGYFFPAIIGAILMAKHSKREREKNTISSDALARDPNAKIWTCSKCGTANMEGVQTCQKCGVSRSWSDAQAAKKGAAPAAQSAPAAPAYDPEATVPSRNTQAQPKPTSILLTITSGPMAGAKFRCREGNPVFIGRDPSRCNLVLNGYTAVSGAHCRLDVGSGGVTVTDLNSSNGTFIGNVRLTPNRPASAANGVEIRLANTDCIFRVRFE